jgi:hypothetical protein
MFGDEARRNYARRTPAIAGVLLLAAFVGVTPLAVLSQERAQQMVQLSGHINYSHTSPPTSGVKLLEDIFQRVRSAPQIAMARNLMKQQQQLAQLPEEALKIRPKTLLGNSRSLAAPSLQIMPQGGAGGTLTAAFAGDGAVGEGTLAGLPQVNMGTHVAEVYMGSRAFPLQQQAHNKPAEKGMWESQQMADAEKKSEQSARPQQPMDLKTATSRFFGIANALQNAQSYGNQVRDQRDRQQIANNEAPQNKADRIAYKLPPTSLDSFVQTQAEGADAGAYDELSERRREDSATKNRKKGSGYYADKDSSSLRAAASPAPTAPAPKRVARQVIGKSVAAKEETSADKKSKLAMADIALLPPNVVTGIPLVRLGSSETQANNALQAIGSMKQQKVNKWTVWSWNRPQSKTGTSLQLYMRNGLLDAMRIFDPSLISQDFGVNLGDSLARVKEKYGEPAFILQEPGPGAGQNYVYPISQIGFQLARPNPGEQPRVVSVLIFNVK